MQQLEVKFSVLIFSRWSGYYTELFASVFALGFVTDTLRFINFKILLDFKKII